MSLLYFIFCTPGIRHSHLSPLCFTSPQKTVGSEVSQIGQIKCIGIGFVGKEDQKKISNNQMCFRSPLPGKVRAKLATNQPLPLDPRPEYAR